MSGVYPLELAPVGSTGNHSHTAVGVGPVPNRLTLEFAVEAIGATPTVTYALQGTMQDSPASTDWEGIMLIPASSETAAATRVVTAVGRTYSHVSQAHSRYFKKYRLVTTANTNVTYSAKLYPQN